MDDYTKQVIEEYKKLQRAVAGFHEAQKLFDINETADAGYVLFRLERKYFEGYRTAYNCLFDLIPPEPVSLLSPNDNNGDSEPG